MRRRHPCVEPVRAVTQTSVSERTYRPRSPPRGTRVHERPLSDPICADQFFLTTMDWCYAFGPNVFDSDLFPHVVVHVHLDPFVAKHLAFRMVLPWSRS